MNNLTPLIPPINLSTTFSQIIPEQGGYSRVDNPTRLLLEKKLAELEKGKFALAFSSGSAAAATFLANFKAGDHIICHQEVYDGTLRLLEKVFSKLGLNFSLVNLNQPNNLNKVINSNTKLVWLENVTNPTLNQLKVSEIAKLTSKNKLLLLVDNTFATPIFRNPLGEGADIVLQSLTKFINGHHHVTAGALALNNQSLFKSLKFLQHTIGAVPSPFDCFLIMQSLLTLPLRMKQHQANAKLVATALKKQPKIDKVSFPNISGVVSFWLKGNELQTIKFLRKLKLISIAHSLGGVNSTILHPVSMMTLSLTKTQLKKLGITDNLVRLSVGLENHQDIINDLIQALK